MQEPREQDLILYYYGEARDASRIRQRIDASPAIRQRYDELCRVLELVDEQPVPEPWDDYGERVWRRLEPRLAEKPSSHRVREWLTGLLAPRRLALATSVAMLVAIGFLAGRYLPDGDSGASLPAAGRERILMVAVGEHLERSEMLLIELANASAEGGRDQSDDLRRAEALLPSNRLYRQAAQRSGQGAVAEVLDDLERLLLDVVHSSDLSAAERDELRQRIEGGGILFRVQVVGSRVQRQNPNIPSLEASGEV